MFKRLLALCVILFPLHSGAVSAQESRPYSGCGLLVVRPFNPERPADIPPIPFYRVPQVARIGDIPAGKIPSLSSVLTPPAGAYVVAVMGRKGDWLRLAYDDAGREGWVKMARWWEYITWDDFLKGRTGRLLSRLKRGESVLRAAPRESAGEICVLSGKESFRITEVREEWILVAVDTGASGWLPWRDGDGRLQIAVDDRPVIQNH